MLYEVRVYLKSGLLDPQASVIESSLKRLGFEEIKQLKTQKVFLIQVEEETPIERIEEMCKQLLANPVMELYQIHKVE
ncbi:MAG: phosphoribosylformylglycinamidine synthase subunit PurS [bacterium]|nr:phosphoribosylformylglycinamidine synthase subunit PurS [bacterium]